MSQTGRKGHHKQQKAVVREISAEAKELKRRSFREYVKRSGLKTAIVRVLVALYEEKDKPDDPLQWMFAMLGYGIPTKPLLYMVRKEAGKLRSKVAALQGENTRLQNLVDIKEAAKEAADLGIDWDELLKVSEDEVDPDDIFNPAP